MKNYKLIAKMAFGSTVYGTRLPTSDMDYKFIYVPDPKDIILQSVKSTIQQNTKVSDTDKNSSEDVDCEGFSLQRYLKLLTDGQTMALDMLFTPREFVEPGECYRIWEVIQANKHRLITSKVNAFVGYCRGQAVRYSLKGDRINAINHVIQILELEQVKNQPLRDCLYQFVLANRYPDLVKIHIINDEAEYLEVNGRKFQVQKTVQECLKQAQLMRNEYGNRAKNAAENNGADSKGLYHAVRVASEAEELLLTGKITFPRPEAELLLKIRNNEISYQDVSFLLDEKLLAVENALQSTSLSKEHDAKFVEDLIFNTYLNEVKKL